MCCLFCFEGERVVFSFLPERKWRRSHVACLTPCVLYSIGWRCASWVVHMLTCAEGRGVLCLVFVYICTEPRFIARVCILRFSFFLLFFCIPFEANAFWITGCKRVGDLIKMRWTQPKEISEKKGGKKGKENLIKKWNKSFILFLLLFKLSFSFFFLFFFQLPL